MAAAAQRQGNMKYLKMFNDHIKSENVVLVYVQNKDDFMSEL